MKSGRFLCTTTEGMAEVAEVVSAAEVVEVG
jgi:hypothetical protein